MDTFSIHREISTYFKNCTINMILSFVTKTKPTSNLLMEEYCIALEIDFPLVLFTDSTRYKYRHFLLCVFMYLRECRPIKLLLVQSQQGKN